MRMEGSMDPSAIGTTGYFTDRFRKVSTARISKLGLETRLLPPGNNRAAVHVLLHNSCQPSLTTLPHVDSCMYELLCALMCVGYTCVYTCK